MKELYQLIYDKREELQEGRTLTYLAKQIGYSRERIIGIFNSKILINENAAKKIITKIAEESLKINKMIENKGVDKTFEYFFKKISF